MNHKAQEGSYSLNPFFPAKGMRRYLWTGLNLQLCKYLPTFDYFYHLKLLIKDKKIRLPGQEDRDPLTCSHGHR